MSDVKPMRIREGMKIGDLIGEFEASGVFGAGRVAQAAEILYKMFSDERATIYLGIAGALCAAGMRALFAKLIEMKLIDVVVSTGANVTHDLVEAFGAKHLKGIHYSSDADLRRRQINRIFDAFIPDDAFVLFEKKIHEILADIDEEKRKGGMGSYELLWEIGERIEDPSSFVYQAAKQKVPIFCPALIDSILGLQIYLFAQDNVLKIDPLRDLKKILEISFDAEKKGVIILGGGVPKNFILQSALITGRGFDYAIQITMDRPETGGLSGASISEAISWGKVREGALWVDVIGDCTIIFPLLVAAAIDRIKRRP